MRALNRGANEQKYLSRCVLDETANARQSGKGIFAEA